MTEVKPTWLNMASALPVSMSRWATDLAPLARSFAVQCFGAAVILFAVLGSLFGLPTRQRPQRSSKSNARALGSEKPRLELVAAGQVRRLFPPIGKVSLEKSSATACATDTFLQAHPHDYDEDLGLFVGWSFGDDKQAGFVNPSQQLAMQQNDQYYVYQQPAHQHQRSQHQHHPQHHHQHPQQQQQHQQQQYQFPQPEQPLLSFEFDDWTPTFAPGSAGSVDSTAPRRGPMRSSQPRSVPRSSAKDMYMGHRPSMGTVSPEYTPPRSDDLRIARSFSVTAVPPAARSFSAADVSERAGDSSAYFAYNASPHSTDSEWVENDLVDSVPSYSPPLNTLNPSMLINESSKQIEQLYELQQLERFVDNLDELDTLDSFNEQIPDQVSPDMFMMPTPDACTPQTNALLMHHFSQTLESPPHDGTMLGPSQYQGPLAKQRGPAASGIPQLSPGSSSPSSRGSSPVNSEGKSNGRGEDAFSCQECGASFRIKGYLTRHLKKHAETKAYTCPFFSSEKERSCHSTGGFSRRDTYKTHLKSRHFIYPKKTPCAARASVAGHCGGCKEQFPTAETWVEKHIQTGECPVLSQPSPGNVIKAEPTMYCVKQEEM